MSEEEKVEPRIVEAVFTSSNASNVGVGGQKSPLAKMIEISMARAVTECYKAGIHDPEKVREAMMAARAATKKWFSQKMAELAEIEAKRREAEG